MPNATPRYRDNAYILSRGWLDPLTALGDAENGDVEAQLFLAVSMFKTGNEAESHRWYIQAAGQGNVEAMMNLGVQFEHGMGCEVSVPLACKWYEQFAESSEANDDNMKILKEDAARKLAFYYYGTESHGRDLQGRHSKLPRLDPQASVKWRQVAAELGDSESAQWLGNIYIHGPDPRFNGQGIQPDPQKAIYWFRKAMELGNGQAACQLAGLYHSGIIPIDQEEHLKLMKVAVFMGYQPAREYLRDYKPVSFKRARKFMRENENGAVQYDDEECPQIYAGKRKWRRPV
jgi:TPR repeat protein